MSEEKILIYDELEEDRFLRGYKIPDNVVDNLVNWYNSNIVRKRNVNRYSHGINSDEYKIKVSNDILVEGDDIYQSQVRNYIDCLDICVKDYIDNFPILYNWKFGYQNHGFNLQYYKPGQGYFAPHCERSYETAGRDRVLVFMTYLNDVEDGGTEFIYQNIKLKAVKGTTWLWPADFTHTHVGQICNFDKYIATGWINYVYEPGEEDVFWPEHQQVKNEEN